MVWKKARGKLGALAPLLGTWSAEAESPQGPIRCQRTFSKVLKESHMHLHAVWQIGALTYEEVAFFGVDRDGTIRFWSFTSDGRQSQGQLADVSDLHSEALGFEAQMPAGLARIAYWPDEQDGFYWVVESRTKKGWNRFTEHHYHRVS